MSGHAAPPNSINSTSTKNKLGAGTLSELPLKNEAATAGPSTMLDQNYSVGLVEKNSSASRMPINATVKDRGNIVLIKLKGHRLSKVYFKTNRTSYSYFLHCYMRFV